MRLGDDRLALGNQPVVDARHARVVIWSACCDRLRSLAGFNCGTDQAKRPTLAVALEIQCSEVEVLVQVAAHQPLLVRFAVEKGLPRMNLLLYRRGQRRITFVRRAHRNPALDRREFALVESWQTVGHTCERLLAREALVVVDA